MFRRDFLKLASLLFVRFSKRKKLKAGERKLVKISNIIIDKSLNVRVYKDEQLTDLKRSIEHFGILTPLIVTDKYKLVSGFQRIKVAKQLGLKKVPIWCCGPAEDSVVNYINLSQNSYRLERNDNV